LLHNGFYIGDVTKHVLCQGYDGNTNQRAHHVEHSIVEEDTCEDVRINSKEERIESQVNQELEVEKVNNFTKNSKGVTIVACRPAALFRRKSCDCRLSSDYNVPIAQAFVNCKTVLVS